MTPRYPVAVSWGLMAAAIVVPAAIALLVALPFWRKGVAMYGAVVGTAIVFAAALVFFLMEGLGIRYRLDACNDTGIICPVRPAPFFRFVIYGVIAMVQSFLLFIADARMSDRHRERAWSAEWRR